MDRKRKAPHSTSTPAASTPAKKTRTADTPDADWHSSDSSDYKVNFTDNGTRRADSEARRQWNYICNVDGCGQRFNRPCRLDAHMRSHNNERPFACPHDGCDKTFPRKDHLQRHLNNAHADADAQRAHVCDWPGCGKSFTSSGRLQRHSDVHASKHYCTGFPPCNEAFRKEKALEAHIKSQHLQVKPYPCAHVDTTTGDRCTSGYQTEAALQRHMAKIHGPKSEDGLYCMVCIPPGTDVEAMQTDAGDTVELPRQPLSFASAEELLAHSLECHPPICPECGQKFKNDLTLKSHCETVHADPADVPKFPCPKPDCDGVFTRKHNLTVHIHTVHDKQFKYVCARDSQNASKHPDLRDWHGENACGASFKAKSSLDQHIRTHHLGLSNRKETRKAAKSKNKPDPSMLTLLTGVGYEQGREVACLAQPCEYRFYMDRDLRRHLRAAHNLSDADATDLIRERDALAGGQFWIGGLDPDPLDLFSADPSMPQTPAGPYYPSPLPGSAKSHSHSQALDPRLGFFDQRFDDLSLLAEDADMDAAMGLGELPPAVDAQQGLQWDMLAPVEQYNMQD
jgi:general transcription factor IIIA